MIDWTDFDATNLLALALFRWDSRDLYRRPGGWSGELRNLVYSNGTEQGFAQEKAETILELAPMFARVLREGVRALDKDPDFEGYVGALAAGDAEQINALDRAADPHEDSDGRR